MVSMKRLLAITFAICATSAMADRSATSPGLPPPDYAKPIFVDARGCTYVRATVGGWQLWVQQLDASKRPACHGAPGQIKQPLNVVAAKQL